MAPVDTLVCVKMLDCIDCFVQSYFQNSFLRNKCYRMSYNEIIYFLLTSLERFVRN